MRSQKLTKFKHFLDMKLRNSNRKFEHIFDKINRIADKNSAQIPNKSFKNTYNSHKRIVSWGSSTSSQWNQYGKFDTYDFE